MAPQLFCAYALFNVFFFSFFFPSACSQPHAACRKNSEISSTKTEFFCAISMSISLAIHDFPEAAAFLFEDDVRIFARALERDDVASPASFVLRTFASQALRNQILVSDVCLNDMLLSLQRLKDPYESAHPRAINTWVAHASVLCECISGVKQLQDKCIPLLRPAAAILSELLQVHQHLQHSRTLRDDEHQQQQQQQQEDRLLQHRSRRRRPSPLRAQGGKQHLLNLSAAALKIVTAVCTRNPSADAVDHHLLDLVFAIVLLRWSAPPRAPSFGSGGGGGGGSVKADDEETELVESAVDALVALCEGGSSLDLGGGNSSGNLALKALAENAGFLRLILEVLQGVRRFPEQSVHSLCSVAVTCIEANGGACRTLVELGAIPTLEDVLARSAAAAAAVHECDDDCDIDDCQLAAQRDADGDEEGAIKAAAIVLTLLNKHVSDGSDEAGTNAAAPSSDDDDDENDENGGENEGEEDGDGGGGSKGKGNCKGNHRNQKRPGGLKVAEINTAVNMWPTSSSSSSSSSAAAAVSSGLASVSSRSTCQSAQMEEVPLADKKSRSPRKSAKMRRRPPTAPKPAAVAARRSSAHATQSPLPPAPQQLHQKKRTLKAPKHFDLCRLQQDDAPGSKKKRMLMQLDSMDSAHLTFANASTLVGAKRGAAASASTAADAKEDGGNTDMRSVAASIDLDTAATIVHANPTVGSTTAASIDGAAADDGDVEDGAASVGNEAAQFEQDGGNETETSMDSFDRQLMASFHAFQCSGDAAPRDASLVVASAASGTAAGGVWFGASLSKKTTHHEGDYDFDMNDGDIDVYAIEPDGPLKTAARRRESLDSAKYTAIEEAKKQQKMQKKKALKDAKTKKLQKQRRQQQESEKRQAAVLAFRFASTPKGKTQAKAATVAKRPAAGSAAASSPATATKRHLSRSRVASAKVKGGKPHSSVSASTATPIDNGEEDEEDEEDDNEGGEDNAVDGTNVRGGQRTFNKSSFQGKKLIKSRRKRVDYTAIELDDIACGIKRFGTRWIDIQLCYPSLKARTPMDIKEKAARIAKANSGGTSAGKPAATGSTAGKALKARPTKIRKTNTTVGRTIASSKDGEDVFSFSQSSGEVRRADQQRQKDKDDALGGPQWSIHDVKSLVKAVEKHGTAWTRILATTNFERPHTTQHLRNKYRNLPDYQKKNKQNVK